MLLDLAKATLAWLVVLSATAAHAEVIKIQDFLLKLEPKWQLKQKHVDDMNILLGIDIDGDHFQINVSRDTDLDKEELVPGANWQVSEANDLFETFSSQFKGQSTQGVFTITDGFSYFGVLSGKNSSAAKLRKIVANLRKQEVGE
jgi:hypothetical protein